MAPKKQEQKQEEQIDSVDRVFAELQKEKKIYGTRAGNEIVAQEVISTGSFIFDEILGGGFRDSGWSRFYSPEECGKSSSALCWGRNWQQKYPEGGFVIYYNAEGRVTKELIDRTGIDTDSSKFRVIDTNNFEAIFTATEKLILENKEKRKYFFIVDSTDACERELDKGKEFGDADKIAGGAALVSAAGKRLSLLFNVTGHHLFLCSQVRDKMAKGPMAQAGGKTASGGNAPKFYSSLICEIKRPWSDRWIYENPSDKDSKIIGRMVEIKLDKTPNEKTGVTVMYPVKYGLKGGVWRAHEAMTVAQSCDIVKQAKAWYNIEESFFEDMKTKGIKLDSDKFQGERALRDCFDTNPDLVEYVLTQGKIIWQAKK